MADFKKLLEYAKTEKQREVINACIEFGSVNGASKKSGLNRSTMRRHIDIVKSQAAKQGHSPEHGMVHTVPDGFAIKGTSTLYKDGEPVIQWVKTNVDQERQIELMNIVIEEFKKDIPKSQPVAIIRKDLDSKLCNLFPIMDFHLGMYSDAGETNGAWNMEIAEKVFMQLIDEMVERCPKAELAVFNENGDFLHFDSMKAVTPGHGHLLDASCRYPELVPAAIRLMKYAIKRLLETHEKVHIICAEGNHNEASSVWMRNFLACYYEDDARVTVDNSKRKYYGFKFGNVFLGFHHGHKKGVANVTEVIAGMFREWFFSCVYRYIHTGHLHHKHIKENILATVEQHNTIAPGDAHSAGGGYLSERSATVITYHSEFGEWGRFPVTFDML